MKKSSVILIFQSITPQFGRRALIFHSTKYTRNTNCNSRCMQVTHTTWGVEVGRKTGVVLPKSRLAICHLFFEKRVSFQSPDLRLLIYTCCVDSHVYGDITINRISGLTTLRRRRTIAVLLRHSVLQDVIISNVTEVSSSESVVKDGDGHTEHT